MEAEKYDLELAQQIVNDRGMVMVDKDEYDALILDVQTLKQEVANLKSITTYPVLYQNDSGWTGSSAITVPGISEYEEIGVYISISDTETSNSQTLCRCSLTKNNYFIGSILRYETSNIQGPGLVMLLNGNTLSNLEIGKWAGTSSVRNTGKIYKIVGITKKSQIVTPTVSN